MSRDDVRQTAIRATGCGHVLGFAPSDSPELVADATRRFEQLARIDDRFELADMSLDDALDAYFAGLNCRDCAIDPVAAALKLRAN